MTKKKTVIFISTALFGMAAILYALTVQFNPFDTTMSDSKPIQVVSAGEADTIIYEGIDEVEQDADIIVEVVVDGQSQVEDYVRDGIVLETYGVTNVKVNKVHKGNVNEGDTLTVAEPGYFNEQGNYVSYEGYKLMDNNGRYLLFMRTGNSDKNILLGLYQGKFDLNIKTEQQNIKMNSISEEQFLKVDYVGDDADHFNKLKNEVLSKYGV